jgi:hypothetical protein
MTWISIIDSICLNQCTCPGHWGRLRRLLREQQRATSVRSELSVTARKLSHQHNTNSRHRGGGTQELRPARVLDWCKSGKLARLCFCCQDIDAVLPVCCGKLANEGMLLFPFVLSNGGCSRFYSPEWQLHERICSKTLT